LQQVARPAALRGGFHRAGGRRGARVAPFDLEALAARERALAREPEERDREGDRGDERGEEPRARQEERADHAERVAALVVLAARGDLGEAFVRAEDRLTRDLARRLAHRGLELGR